VKVNNNLGFVICGSTAADVVITWQDILLNLIISSVIYIPFLFSKVYRNTSHEPKDG